MRSKYRNVAMLSALVTLALAVSASAASAAELKDEWHVNKSALASGVTKEFAIKKKAGTHFYMTFWEPGIKEKVEVGGVKLKAGASHKVIGGKPGSFEGTLEFEKLAFTQEALKTKCEILPIVTRAIKGELVEAQEEVEHKLKGTGIPELALYPLVGEEWFTMTIKSTPGHECVFAGPTGPGEYTFWATTEPSSVDRFIVEVSPASTEAKVDGWSFKPKHLAFKKSNGETGEVFEEFDNNSSGLNIEEPDETEMELVSKEVFGAF